MNRYAIAALLGIVIFGLAVAFAFPRLVWPRGETARDGEEVARRIEELESRLDARLRSLESRLAAHHVESGAPDPEAPSQPGILAEAGRPLDDVVERFARMEARVDALEVQVRGLAKDPIARGLEYVASASPALRRKGIKLLEKMAWVDPEARDAIRGMLEDPDAHVREEALKSLVDLKDRQFLPQILGLLSDPEAFVRGKVIKQTDNLLGPGFDSAQVELAVKAIGERISDADPAVRRDAAKTLGKLRSLDAVAPLVSALADPDPVVRREAVESLGDLGASSSAPRLRTLYDQGSGELALPLAVALRRLGDEQPLQAELGRLVRLASVDGDPRTRREAIRALARYGGAAYRDPIAKLLEDPSPEVRAEATQALERLGR